MTDPNIADLRALLYVQEKCEWDNELVAIKRLSDGKIVAYTLGYSSDWLIDRLDRAERAEQAEREMPPELGEQMATWERELTDYAQRSDSSGRAARFGLDVLKALRRSRMASMVERERDALRIADHIVTRLGRRPAAGGDYRGYAWAQAEAELSVFIEQYNALRTTAPARDGGE